MSDVIGPVALDVVSSLPTLPCLADKIMWWGKRGNRAGGPAMSEDEDDEVEDDDDAEAPDDSVALPISHHCLPLAVITDLVEGFGAKHVIDLTPTPLPLAIKLLEMGCSYFAMCASEKMADSLKEQLVNGVSQRKHKT